MSNTLDPMPPAGDKSILCCYVNATSKIQVARITNIPNWYFERVVFPGQRLIFEADSQAKLEIHTGMMASSILSDTISCRRLAIESMEGDCDPVSNREPAGNEITPKQVSPSTSSITSHLHQDLELSVSGEAKRPSSVA